MKIFLTFASTAMDTTISFATAKFFTSTLSTWTPQGSQATLNTSSTVLAISSLADSREERV